MWLDKHRHGDERKVKAEKNSDIEIIAHKKATGEVVKQAEAINKKLNKLLAENHFTLKIYLSAGGKRGKT